MEYDVIIVGAGMAGLTSAAYLTKAGHRVLLCEQQEKVGGLVNSFNYKGYTFDGGIRAIENSGIISPMLRQLGIDVAFTKNTVSLIVEQEKVNIETVGSISEYQVFLETLFPENKKDIQNIINEIKRVMKYMDVLYGIDNPLFVDYQKDLGYITQTILPWFFKYLTTIGKIEKLDEPIDEYLQHFTTNKGLIDVIGQHFFYKTPAFFALSYFSLYLDYNFPIGGTGVLAEKMADFIVEHGGEIKTNCAVASIDSKHKKMTDEHGNESYYKKIIWAADTKSLYRAVDIETVENASDVKSIVNEKEMIADKIGGDSILTVYITVDAQPEDIADYMTEHVFYTPSKKGLSSMKYQDVKARIMAGEKNIEKAEIIQWLTEYLEMNTFEISCPALRDKSLAPEGKTGLIVSTLFDYTVTKYFQEIGFYDEFKTLSEQIISDILFTNLLSTFNGKMIETFSSTPITIEKFTSNTGGAITGWAFTNKPLPSVAKLSKVASSIKTKIPDIYQAGQWTFSPSGLPIAVMTGKLAADEVNKKLK